jgi:hypothetical protein
MLQARRTPQERYAMLVETFVSNPDVTPPDASSPSKKPFGSSTLRVKGKTFAMLVGDTLVVKLPRQRVDALIESGDGQRFDPGHGRLMKEWLSLESSTDEASLSLAREALEFVGSKSSPS